MDGTDVRLLLIIPRVIVKWETDKAGSFLKLKHENLCSGNPKFFWSFIYNPFWPVSILWYYPFKNAHVRFLVQTGLAIEPIWVPDRPFHFGFEFAETFKFKTKSPIWWIRTVSWRLSMKVSDYSEYFSKELKIHSAYLANTHYLFENHLIPYIYWK